MLLNKRAFPVISTLIVVISQWPGTTSACLTFKVASLVQVSHQAESEFHVLCEMTIKRSQSILFAVNPHLAFHVMEHAGLQAGRMKIRGRSKAQLYQVSVTTRVVEHKCIRQHLKQPPPL